MGPLSSLKARVDFLNTLTTARAQGAQVLVESEALPGGAYVTPGLYEVTGDEEFLTEELFGPHVSFEVAESPDDAYRQAADTPYGLSAALFSASSDALEDFYDVVRAGVINFNRSTNGASRSVAFRWHRNERQLASSWFLRSTFKHVSGRLYAGAVQARRRRPSPRTSAGRGLVRGEVFADRGSAMGEGYRMSTIESRQRAHVFYTWTAQNQAKPITITGGEGAFFFDEEGHKWLDFESQVYNCNLGHGESRITDAIAQQASQLACAHPASVFETKAALGEALARVSPGDLNRFFLCLSGSEAIENAYKMARLLTGRSKVIARRRSYHGASMGAVSLTGDPRRWPVEPGLWGVVRAEDPYCYRCPFGKEPKTCGIQCAQNLEYIIEMEGPQNIAAIFLEGMTGANGGFIPPDEYWPMIREICDKHGILLISDEVCSGFGRTGRWFAVDHWGVVPDMITMAKGITSGYAPLGAVAIRDELAQRFDDEMLWCGLTGYAHPISCAAALSAIQIYESDNLIARSQKLGQQLEQRLRELYNRFDIIGDVRNLGLWGTIEFVADRTTKEPLVPYGFKATGSEFLNRLKSGLAARRIHIAQRWTHLFIVPPLCISSADLDRGMDLIADAIEEALAGSV